MQRGKFHYKSTIAQYIKYLISSIENAIENRQPTIDNRQSPNLFRFLQLHRKMPHDRCFSHYTQS